MDDALRIAILALATSSVYAVAASGLVVTYTTSGIFNFSHGAIAMVSAFVYWQLSTPNTASLSWFAPLLALVIVAPGFVFARHVNGQLAARSGGRLPAPIAALSALATYGTVFVGALYVLGQLWSSESSGVPVPLALLLTLGGFAPGLGIVIDRVLMRRLHDSPPIVRLVVPVALLVLFIQLATVVWPPGTATRNLPRFFLGESITIGEVAVTYHQLVVMGAAVAVAVLLRILLYNTRTGTAMRAVVDSRDLASLAGADPDRTSSLAWALGCALAGLAGILVAPIQLLDPVQLTILVISSYAAALFGRLRSLPLTVVGALVLGLAVEVVRNYSNDVPNWLNATTVPAIVLFLVLLVVPQDKVDVFGQRKDRSRIPNPTVGRAAVAGAVLVAVAFLIPSLMQGDVFRAVGDGMALAIIGLSLVPLVGYAGQMSLAPMAFAGLGAMFALLLAPGGSVVGLLAAAALCALVGTAVALPTLRLKGLYLALATMAFALFCENAVFSQVASFKATNTSFERVDLFGYRVSSDDGYLLLMAGVFALLGVAVTALRRSPFGRRLQAMKDSPAACATIGLNTVTLKLQVFALSAAVAGIGGVLLAGWRTQAGPQQFSLLEGTQSGLPLILLTVVGGITAVAGALVGAMLFVLLPVVGSTYPALKDLLALAPGLAGVSLAANPNGAINQTATQVGDLVARVRARTRGERPPDDGAAKPVRALLAPGPPDVVPELVGVGSSPSRREVAALDRELGLSWGLPDGDA